MQPGETQSPQIQVAAILTNPVGEVDAFALLRDGEEPKKLTGRVRDENLQNDAIVLKKLNAALTSFTDALGDVGSQNERIAAQLEQTEALLNKHVDILSGSEKFARLILDDKWQGAEADERSIAQEQREAEEGARKLEAERVQREQERLQDLKRADQMERDRKQTAARGGVRGVRGTRASIRAARGSSRGGKLILIKLE
ncbi:hypothetical protein B0H11DRAFT_1909324 [Mycena galericulata]|nr:hypothetical protein B0H11DRAFT_1909324 [Mycena galericulata]